MGTKDNKYDNNNNNLSIRILEAYSRDVGRGVARIDYESMDALNASTGDVIEIKGNKRRTLATLPFR
jgi:transitional endoplasmic reticulum ATPase